MYRIFHKMVILCKCCKTFNSYNFVPVFIATQLLIWKQIEENNRDWTRGGEKIFSLPEYKNENRGRSKKVWNPDRILENT